MHAVVHTRTLHDMCRQYRLAYATGSTTSLGVTSGSLTPFRNPPDRVLNKVHFTHLPDQRGAAAHGSTLG